VKRCLIGDAFRAKCRRRFSTRGWAARPRSALVINQKCAGRGLKVERQRSAACGLIEHGTSNRTLHPGNPHCQSCAEVAGFRVGQGGLAARLDGHRRSNCADSDGTEGALVYAGKRCVWKGELDPVERGAELRPLSRQMLRTVAEAGRRRQGANLLELRLLTADQPGFALRQRQGSDRRANERSGAPSMPQFTEKDFTQGGSHCCQYGFCGTLQKFRLSGHFGHSSHGLFRPWLKAERRGRSSSPRA